jgi:hypothetical protein
MRLRALATYARIPAALAIGLGVTASACGDDDSGGTPATGGAGGVSGSSGSKSAGGTASGGAPSAGATASGGIPSAGGASSGGAPSTGGASSGGTAGAAGASGGTAGAAGASGGAAGASGGAAGSGGASTGGAGAGGADAGADASTGGGGAGGATVDGGEPIDAGDAGPNYVPPTPQLPAPVAYITGGQIAPLGTYTGIHGTALMVRTADGKTTVQLNVEGLTANTAYPVHVHALPCEVNTADGHYMLDPTAAAGQANEIWAPFTTDADGVGRASTTVNHAARPEAMSIVVHDPAANNAKMACANLSPAPLATTTARGTFAPFALATIDERNVAGTATLVRAASGTTVTLAVTGLDATGMYMAHVHALPCAVNTADGHYKIDPTNTATVESNELWPAISGTPLTTTHVARLDAQSVVIHRTDLGVTPAPKVACADLVRVEAYGPFATAGTVIANGRNITGTGGMTRTVPGTTSATITLAGLVANLNYRIQVHEASCALRNGRNRYMIDPALNPSGMANEIWLDLTASGNGTGSRTVSLSHLARPEATSIVVQNAAGTFRACVDLK